MENIVVIQVPTQQCSSIANRDIEVTTKHYLRFSFWWETETKSVQHAVITALSDWLHSPQPDPRAWGWGKRCRPDWANKRLVHNTPEWLHSCICSTYVTKMQLWLKLAINMKCAFANTSTCTRKSNPVRKSRLSLVMDEYDNRMFTTYALTYHWKKNTNVILMKYHDRKRSTNLPCSTSSVFYINNIEFRSSCSHDVLSPVHSNIFGTWVVNQNQASCCEPCCGLWCHLVEIFYWWWPFSARCFGPCLACPWPLASEVTPATNCNHVTCTCIRHQLRTRSLMLQYGLAPICQLQHSHVNSWQILRRDKIYA